jgi:hypothetical protein
MFPKSRTTTKPPSRRNGALTRGWCDVISLSQTASLYSTTSSKSQHCTKLTSYHSNPYPTQLRPKNGDTSYQNLRRTLASAQSSEAKALTVADGCATHRHHTFRCQHQSLVPASGTAPIRLARVEEVIIQGTGRVRHHVRLT